MLPFRLSTSAIISNDAVPAHYETVGRSAYASNPELLTLQQFGPARKAADVLFLQPWIMSFMSVLFDYFSAGSDEEAATVIDRVGGPGSQATIVQPEPTRGIFGLKRRTVSPVFGTDPELVVYDTVSTKNLDPVVQLGTLEELITGKAYDDIVQDPRSGHEVAIGAGGGRLVLTLTGALTSALAAADDDILEQVAVPWSETEEFGNAADPQDLADFLKSLSRLARRADASGKRLYCWVCV